MQEAVARAPVSKGGDAVNTVFGAIAGVVGGLFGLLTILILTFYLLVEADQLRGTLLRLFPADRRAAWRQSSATSPSRSARGWSDSSRSARSSARRPRWGCG